MSLNYPTTPSPPQLRVQIAERRKQPNVARIENARRAVRRTKIAPFEKVSHRDDRRPRRTRLVRPLRERHLARNPQRKTHPDATL